MPLPTPRRGESKNNFISRFIKATQGEFKSQEQRSAAAYRTWDDSKRKGARK